MICFPARLRRANSVDSFMVPLLPTAQSMMSVASTNGRSLSLESIPLVDTVPLLRVPEQPSHLASNCLTHSTKNNEQSDANTNIISTSSTDSTLSEETERKDTVSTVQVSKPLYGIYYKGLPVHIISLGYLLIVSLGYLATTYLLLRLFYILFRNYVYLLRLSTYGLCIIDIMG